MIKKYTTLSAVIKSIAICVVMCLLFASCANTTTKKTKEKTTHNSEAEMVYKLKKGVESKKTQDVIKTFDNSHDEFTTTTEYTTISTIVDCRYKNKMSIPEIIKMKKRIDNNEKENEIFAQNVYKNVYDNTKKYEFNVIIRYTTSDSRFITQYTLPAQKGKEYIEKLKQKE